MGLGFVSSPIPIGKGYKVLSTYVQKILYKNVQLL